MCSRSFETRSLPSSLATTHRGFAFYVAFPKSSIRPVGFAHDHSHRPVFAPAALAALPSTRAIPDRDVFYVADPISSIETRRGEDQAAVSDSGYSFCRRHGCHYSYSAHAS
jgi:hypothetical protein